MATVEFRVEGKARPRLVGLNVGYCCFSGVNAATSQVVDDIVEDACSAARRKFTDVKTISEDNVVKGVRGIFSKVGIDPTKDRPSGEALIRRVVGGQGIYRINAVVDVNNAVSLLTGCPCGVYDMERMSGRVVTFSVGEAGQAYEGITGKPMNAENRIVTIDSAGIFGGPTADSKRTCVTLQTKTALMLIYCPASISDAVLNWAIEKAKDAMIRATGAQVTGSGIYRIK